MAKIKALRRCEICRPLSYRDLAFLCPYIHEERAKEGEWIAKAGKPTQGLIVLVEGRVKVSLQHSDEDYIVLGPSDYFGELSLIEGDVMRAVGVMAMEPVEYLRMDAGDFHHLQQTAPEVAGRLAQGILEAYAQKVSAVRSFLA